jgi:acyl-CoA synthetase (NDP forming)
MPHEDILQMENELKTLKFRLQNFKKQSLSASDDTPNVLDITEKAKIKAFEIMIETMEHQLSNLKASLTYGPGGGIMHEDTWQNDF